MTDCKILDLKQWSRRKKAHTVLYQFTQQELHPVPPYTKMDFTNAKQSLQTLLRSWTLQEQDYNLKNSILAAYTPLETLSRGTNTTTITKVNYRKENTRTAYIESLKQDPHNCSTRLNLES